MILNRIPMAYRRSLAAINYTEMFATFSPAASATWTEYNLLTNHSVPANAVVEIFARNWHTAAREMGIRAKSSSLARIIDVDRLWYHTGKAADRFLVQADGDGKIEYYCEAHTADLDFLITGYWTGIEFTELWEPANPTSNATWESVTLSSPAANSVCAVTIRQRAVYNREGGARAYGSELDRKWPIARRWYGQNTYTLMVKCDASKRIELYSENTSNIDFIIQGYFDSRIDYEELAQSISIDTDATWVDVDISSYLDTGNEVCDVLVGNNDSADGHEAGARKDGSALDRYIKVPKVQSSSYPRGYIISVQASSGNIEAYHADATYQYFYLWGYFKW